MSNTSGAETPSAHIVLVEGDDRYREKLTMQLENLGFRVSAYKDGDVASRLIPAMKPLPDLMFLGLNLPKLPGLEVLRIIRDSPRSKSLPTVILTANKDEAVMRSLIKLGVRDFLMTPASEPVLRDRLQCLKVRLGTNDARAILSLCLVESQEVFLTPTFRRFRNKGLRPYHIRYQKKFFVALMRESFTRSQLLMLDEDMIAPHFKIYLDASPWIPVWPVDAVPRDIRPVDEAELKKNLGGELFDLVNACAGGSAGSNSDAS